MLFDQLASLTLFDAIIAFVCCFSLEETLYTTHLISSSGLHHWLLFFTLPGNRNNKIFKNKIFSLIFPFWLNMEMIENTAQSFPITSQVKILISRFVIFLFPFFLRLLIIYCASHASSWIMAFLKSLLNFPISNCSKCTMRGQIPLIQQENKDIKAVNEANILFI